MTKTRILKSNLDSSVKDFMKAVTEMTLFYYGPWRNAKHFGYDYEQDKRDGTNIKKGIKRAIDAARGDAQDEFFQAVLPSMFPLEAVSAREQTFIEKFSDKPIIHQEMEYLLDAFLAEQNARLEEVVRRLQQETSDSMRTAAYYEQLLELNEIEQRLKRFNGENKEVLENLDRLIEENDGDLDSEDVLSEKPENQNSRRKFKKILGKHITQKKDWPAMPVEFPKQLEVIAFGPADVIREYLAICEARAETQAGADQPFCLCGTARFLAAVTALSDFVKNKRNTALLEEIRGNIAFRVMPVLPSKYSAFTNSYILVGNSLYYIDANDTLEVVNIDVDQFKRDIAARFVGHFQLVGDKKEIWFLGAPIIPAHTIYLSRDFVKKYLIDKGHTPASAFEHIFRSDLLSAIMDANPDTRAMLDKAERSFKQHRQNLQRANRFEDKT